MKELIFVDTETGGFSATDDALVELTWARRTGEPKTLWFGVTEVPEFIDNLIGFTARGLSGRLSTWDEILEFKEASDGATMVAANPAFDKSFLEANDLWHFHHRMLDIETYAMAKLNEPEVPGMSYIYKLLKDYTDITAPDHTSRNDVLCMRDAFLFLERV